MIIVKSVYSMNVVKMELIDAEARNFLTSCTESMIKCAAGINHCGNKIRMIHKSNTTEVYPVCGENEEWDHAVLCEKNNDNREEWSKELEKKLKKVEQCKNAEEENKVIVQKCCENLISVLIAIIILVVKELVMLN